MFGKKKYSCSSCKTGKDLYELDKYAEECPYIFCYKENKCGYYKPLETEKHTLWSKISGVFTSRKKN